MALFQEEEPILMGMNLYKYFSAPSKAGYISSIGNAWGYLLGGLVSDGSGGYPSGHNGKPSYVTNTSQLCGTGGGQDAGGDGAHVGLFGYGGQGEGYLSAGGGGGFFGGGSGYIQAGGGGGSSFVYTEEMNWYMQLQDLITDFDPADYLAYGEAEFDYNRRFQNGLVQISSGNDITQFDYTGSVQTFTVPTDGYYILQCWGAQGGTLSIQEDYTSKYTGGCGGWSKATFFLKAGTVLYVYVGQYGGTLKAPLRPFGGGGGAAGACLAGGGASDVRLIEGNLYSRLIVAGGGGGCGNTSSDGLSLLSGASSAVCPSTGTNPAENVTPTTGKQMFIISDISVATVDLTYTCSYDIDVDDYIKLNLYVDGEKRGELSKTPTAGGGASSWVFSNFSDWLTDETTPYWAVIEATVETSLGGFVIPTNGLVIRVSTKTRAEDAKPTITKLYMIAPSILKMGSLVKMTLVEVVAPIDITQLNSTVKLGSLVKITLVETAIPPDITTLDSTVKMGSLVKITLVEPPVQYDPTKQKVQIKMGSIIKIKIK